MMICYVPFVICNPNGCVSVMYIQSCLAHSLSWNVVITEHWLISGIVSPCGLFKHDMITAVGRQPHFNGLNSHIVFPDGCVSYLGHWLIFHSLERWDVGHSAVPEYGFTQLLCPHRQERRTDTVLVRFWCSSGADPGQFWVCRTRVQSQLPVCVAFKLADKDKCSQTFSKKYVLPSVCLCMGLEHLEFTPTVWGGRTYVDAGLSVIVWIKQFGMFTWKSSKNVRLLFVEV